MKSAKAQPMFPVLPLRDVVVYPNMVIPLFVGREKSMRALERAMQADKQIILLAQKAAEIDDPTAADLYEVGTLAQVLQLLKLPDGTVKVLVEGGERARVHGLTEHEGALEARVETLTTVPALDAREVGVAVKSLNELFEQYVKTNRKLPPSCWQRSRESTSLGALLTPLRRIYRSESRTSRSCLRRWMWQSAWRC